MTTPWSALAKLSPTYLLLFGTALGYAGLIALAGNRPVVWLSGGVVAAMMLGSWTRGAQPSASTRSADASNLLNAPKFQQQIEAIQAQIPPGKHQAWQSTQQLSLKCQVCAAGICDREPSLRSELLEALHTVVHLTQQIADGLQVQAQIQSPAYQKMLQKRLHQSNKRLQQTYLQLQQLQDQIALASLSQEDTALPLSLAKLIAANQEILDI